MPIVYFITDVQRGEIPQVPVQVVPYRMVWLAPTDEKRGMNYRMMLDQFQHNYPEGRDEPIGIDLLDCNEISATWTAGRSVGQVVLHSLLPGREAEGLQRFVTLHFLTRRFLDDDNRVLAGMESLANFSLCADSPLVIYENDQPGYAVKQYTALRYGLPELIAAFFTTFYSA